MLGIPTPLIIFIVAIIVFVLIRIIARIPVSPDPWEGEIKREDLENNSIPVCSKCTKVVKGPLQDYCPYCGNVTGEYTRYVPFVNIPFTALSDPRGLAIRLMTIRYT